MAAFPVINVIKLKGRENYDVWAFAAKKYLILEGLKKYIEAEPAKDNVAEALEDEKAQAKIVLLLDPSIYSHVKDATTTKALWSKLKSMYDDSGFSRKITLLRSLIGIRLETSDSMEDYVNQIIETSQKLNNTGFKIDDIWVGSLLLAGLTEKFMPMIMAIEHSGINITADAIKSKLLDFQDETVGNASSAFYSRNRSTGGAHSSVGSGSERAVGKADGNSDRKTKTNVRCYKCKKLGHFMNNCPLKDKNKANAFSVVFAAGNYGANDFYLDSGASVHILVKEDLFTNMNSCKNEVVVANNASLPVNKRGNALIRTVVGNKDVEIVVKDAFHVPNMSTNLISVSRLIANGNDIVFEDTGCKVLQQERVDSGG